MNVAELDDKLAWEGGVLATLEHGLPSKYIEDEQLRTAWTYLQDEYDRFEVHVRAFEAILEGKLAASSV